VRLAGDAVMVAADAAASVTSPQAEADVTEKMVAPYHDPNYADRKGYDSGFLAGFDVPLPRPTKPSQLAALADGSHVIPYHHFSIVMDKRRRLPVFTASNLDFSSAKKNPSPATTPARDCPASARTTWSCGSSTRGCPPPAN
jgi:endonuclease G, mitochondrial